MSESSIIYPIYFLIVERVHKGWHFHYGGRTFYNPRNVPVEHEDRERRYGLTKKKMVIEIFRINGGRLGFYLVNLRDRKYYYCGEEWADVKTTFLNIGIGQRDPLDKE